MSVLIWNAYGKNVCPEEDIARRFLFPGVTCFERAEMMTSHDIFWDTTDIVRFFRGPDVIDLFFLTDTDLFTSDPKFVEECRECPSASGGNVSTRP
jgi:hypothetical protein